MGDYKDGRIIVAGDVTVDWLQASNGALHTIQDWNADEESHLYRQRGGAALLADLISTLLSISTKDHDWEIVQAINAPENPQPGDPDQHHTYSLWAPFPYGSKPPLDRESRAWRVERFLGLERRISNPGIKSTGSTGTNPGQTSIAVLDDSNLGFRDDPGSWPPNIIDQSGWVVLKMAQPVAQGALWEKLVSQPPEKFVVITTAQDLRKTSVQISQKISWERTAQDVAWELTYNPQVNALTQSARVIITFGCAGAILLERDDQGHVQARLFFDSNTLEGVWERAFPGSMFGYTTCLTAAVVHQILQDFDQPDIGRGIQAGISSGRLLHKEGYGERGSQPVKANLRFPHASIAKEIIQEAQPLAKAIVQDPTGSLLVAPPPEKPRMQRGYWTILEDRFTDQLDMIARQIVLEGSNSALRQVPVGRFGALVTVDRREIEALNGIQQLIAEYCLRPQKKPLSIAVFGPPGSGKSFGVEQVAKSVLGEISVLSFNISQFRQPDALLDALHQVRDVGLSGKIPLVFWDEFDTSLDGQPLGWLRYFLAPMQDGAFQEGQIVHPIGRCIFVFAGGTSHRMELFGSEWSESEQRAIKLPDFISRLKGFLNVLGPNPIEGPKSDPYYVLRRALILRSIFERNASQILSNQEGKRLVQIDSGLLRAFLQTSTYKHGVRSMESLVSMSTLAGKSAYERSSLPPEEQLNLHVVAPEFLALMQQLELEGNLLENLAEAAHNIFCEGLKSAGYNYSPVTNAAEKTHSSLLPYDELPEDEKEQNRQNVRDIAEKLALAGYIMRPARSNEPPFDFPGTDLELLAEREHERWVKDKQKTGWVYAPVTDKQLKEHKDLQEWSQLSEEEKDKDRRMVRGIPAILARAGYAIEKLG